MGYGVGVCGGHDGAEGVEEVTKKDYELIASAINRAWSQTSMETNPVNVFDQVITYLCDEMSKDNIQFNEARFVRACYA